MLLPCSPLTFSVVMCNCVVDSKSSLWLNCQVRMIWFCGFMEDGFSFLFRIIFYFSLIFIYSFVYHMYVLI